MKRSLVGLFGGTFDPIHKGHLQVAKGLLELIPLEWIDFIPCGQPPHGKHPIASPSDRTEMIRLAIEGESKFRLNTLEVDRDTVSYTVDTVKACHLLYKDKVLCLILATDVISHLNEWFHWQELLEYCHILIADRPQFELTSAPWMKNLLSTHRVESIEALMEVKHGKILEMHPSPSRITASDIRRYFSRGEYSKVESLVPAPVLSYIRKHHIYLE